MSVVLPLPLAPTIAVIFPSGMKASIFFNTKGDLGPSY